MACGMNVKLSLEREKYAVANNHKFSIYGMMRIHLGFPGVANKRFGCLFQICLNGFTLFPTEMGCIGRVRLGF